MIILKKLERNINFWFLLFTSIFFFFLRFPSMFEPNWYGDEGIYQVLGLGINSGRILYRDVFDNKPPFLYLLYAFFNSDQFLLRLASLIFGVISIIVFFKLSEKILEQRNARYLATFVFAFLFGLPLIEGNIANAENFMLLFNILGGYLIFKTLELKDVEKKFKLLFFAGVVLSISFLFKVVGLFDFASFLVFLFFVNFSGKLKDIFNLNNLKNEITNLFPYILGFITPILIVILYFILNGAFSYFIKATFSNNVGYVGYGNKFIIPQGFLILKLLLLSLSLLFIFIKRKALGKESVFVYIWLLFSLFSAFFSQRPYTHYVLVVLPAISLLLGLVVLKNKYFRFNFFISLITIILLIFNFTYYVKTIFYYQNFISFMTGQKSVYQYQRFFDGNTPNDYELASYINLYAKRNDNIFIWGNNSQLYTLTNKLPPGRYTVAYHITSYKDGFENTLKGLESTNPKFVIIMKNVSPYPFSLLNYRQKININGINLYERIY